MVTDHRHDSGWSSPSPSLGRALELSWSITLLDQDSAPYSSWSPDHKRVAERRRTTRVLLSAAASPLATDGIHKGVVSDLPDAVVDAACRRVPPRSTESPDGRWSVTLWDELDHPVLTWTYGPPHVWLVW